MKKPNLFILLSIVTATSIFASAATCSLCGLPVSVVSTTDISIDAESTGATDKKSTETIAEETTTESTVQDTSQDEPLEAPSLSIYIDQGPFYSAADDVCYYIIASEMYGNPYPTLTWSKNDSVSLPQGKTQVNLTRGQTYTLVATAANSIDTITKSLELSWGCDGQVSEDIQQEGNEDNEQEDIEDTSGEGGEPQIITAKMPVVFSETGTFGTFFDSESITAGDSLANVNMQGFISFDISSLKDTQIKEVKFILHVDKIFGDLSIYNKFYTGVCYWGEGAPTQDSLDKPVTGVIFTRTPSSLREGENIVAAHTTPNAGLVRDIQNSINNGKARFKFKLYFSGVLTDNDSSFDLIDFNPSSVVLEVKHVKQ